MTLKCIYSNILVRRNLGVIHLFEYPFIKSLIVFNDNNDKAMIENDN